MQSISIYEQKYMKTYVSEMLHFVIFMYFAQNILRIKIKQQKLEKN